MEVPFVQELLDNSKAIGIFIYGDGGKILYANKAAANIFGYDKAEQFIGKNFLDHIEDEQIDDIKSAIARRLKGETFPAEYVSVTLKTADGNYKSTESFAYTITYEGKYAGLVLVVDRTEKVALSRLYRSLSEINQLILRISSEDELVKKVCDVLVDRTNYLACGVGAVDESHLNVEIFYVRSKIDGIKSILDSLKISVDVSNPCGRGAVSEAYRTKTVSYRADVFSDPNLKCWYKYYKQFGIRSICAIPVLKKGLVEYMFFIVDRFKNSFSDLNLALLEELKSDVSFALENIELNRNARILKKAIDESHDWTLITDDKGIIQFANKTVSKLSGFEIDEIIGNKPSIFKSNYQDKEFYKGLWETIKRGDVFDGVIVNKAKDGSLIYLDKSIIPISEKGRITNFVDLSKDITDGVKKNKQLEFQSRIYNTLFHVSDLSIKSANEEEFLKGLTSVFVEYMGMDAAFLTKLFNKRLKVYSKFSKNDKFLAFIDFSTSKFAELIEKRVHEFFPLQKSIKYGRVYFMNNVERFITNKIGDSKLRKSFLEEVKAVGIGSCASLPIIKGGKPIGAIVVLSRSENVYEKTTYSLFNMVMNQIKFSLDRFERDKFSKMAMSALDTGFEFIVITDDKFNIVYANEKALEISGYKKEELIGKHHSVFSAGEHDREFSRNFYAQLEKGDIFSNVMKYKAKNGEIKDFFVTILPFEMDGRITNYIAYGKQITDKASLENRLNKLLYYDSITNLINMTSFRKALDKLLKGFFGLGAVVVINPLGFKRVNEAYSFSFGNKVLKEIAERIEGEVKKYDVVAKLESDRFGVIIKNLKNELDALIVVDRILKRLSEPYLIDGKVVSLSFNAGLSLIPRDGDKAEELLHKSMVALSDAGSKEGKRIGFFSKELEEKAIMRLSLKHDLERALGNNEFVLFYQPYVDREGKLAGAESLLRWIKDGNIISPSKFIDYLEQLEFVVDVERGSIKAVFDFFKKIKSEGAKCVPISINLSKRSLKSMGLYEEVKRMLEIYDIDSECVKIEIVERAFLEDFEKVNRLINKMKNIGVLFYLDDFGTGYSSLSYLSNIPIDVVKIDISFTRRILTDRKAQSVVSSIIYLAKNLGIKTIAEGVENIDQFELLKSMGCDYFQGYMFYKPMPEEEFLKLL